MRNAPIPISLTIVAVLFILTGITALIEVLYSLLEGHLYINISVVCLLVGFGLLKLKEGWRVCALVFTWFGLILIPVIVIIFIFVPGPLDLTVGGQVVGQASKFWGLGIATVLFAIEYWQYRVLTRPDVKALFEASRGSHDKPDETPSRPDPAGEEGSRLTP